MNKTKLLVLAAIVVLGTATGCSSRKKTTSSPKTAETQTNAKGLATTTPASQQTPLSTDPFVAPLLKTPRSVDVDVLWVRKKRDPKNKKNILKTGGTTRVTLTVSPNRDKISRIGFTEQFPGGAGGMWKASLWIAARSAAQAVGRELVDYGFWGGSQGFIDGPSAGALFSAGFLAVILNQPVKPEVTMTGTVNPDGTVGLVGGLEHKFLAAIKAGKKVLGYPEGNKIQKGKSGRVVNLETLAEENGAKAVPVRDIYEAYKLLTGKPFPGRKRATTKDMALSKDLQVKLTKLAAAWVEKHKTYVKKAQEHTFDKRSKNLYEHRLKPSLLYKKMWDKTSKEGKLGAAYYSSIRSATWAYTAEKFTDVIYLWSEWISIANKKLRNARAVFMKLLLKRRKRRMRRLAQVKCEKNKWQGKACRKLKKELKKEKREQKRAARKRKTRGKRRRKKQPKIVRNPQKIPPKPPQDFMKILMKLAEEMNEKTKALEIIKKKLAKRSPKTVDPAISLVAANAELLQGASFALLGKTRMLRLKKYKKFTEYMKKRQKRHGKRPTSYRSARQMRLWATKTVQYVDETVKYAGIAFGKATLGYELATLYTPGGKRVDVSEQRMKSIANQLFASAKANLDLIRSVFKRQRMGRFILNILSARNPEYLIANLGTSKAGKAVLKFSEAGRLGEHIELGSGYAALGAAVASYMASTKIIAKWFNLRVKHKTGRAVAKVGRPMTLTNALHRARIFALEAAYRAKKTSGKVPTFSKILFQTADVLKKESLSGQVKALELYWRAALYSRLAEMLIGPGKPPEETTAFEKSAPFHSMVRHSLLSE